MSLRLNNQTATPLGIGLLAATLSLSLSSVTVNAATLTPKVFLSGEILENSEVFSADTLDFEVAVAELFTVSISESGTLGNLLVAVNTIENPTSPQASLDWNKVAHSFSQLQFDAPQWGREIQPDILPQVAGNNIMRGIYEFELPVAVTRESDTFTFDPPFLATWPSNLSLPKVSVLNAPTSGLNVPSYGGVSNAGLRLPTYGAIGRLASVGLSDTVVIRGGDGVNMERQSIRAQFAKVWQNNVDARWDLYPTEVSRTMPTEVKGSLPSHISQMEQVFDTQIDVAFQLMPQSRFPTSLDLTDDYVKTSPMLNRDYATARLKVTQDNQTLLRESAQEATQRLVELQQQQQNQYYNRNRELRQQRR